VRKRKMWKRTIVDEVVELEHVDPLSPQYEICQEVLKEERSEKRKEEDGESQRGLLPQ
jgi:hypothetical protein